MDKCVDVFAPGCKVLSSDICPLGHCKNDSEECIAGMMYNNTCRKFRTGTSQSAPLVAGAIALLLEKCPKLTNLLIKYIFLRYSFSTIKVQFCKAIQYAATINKCINPQDSILATIVSTSDHLLYIGSILESTINCTIF